MEPILFAGLVFVGVILVFASMLMGQALDPVQARLQQIAVRPRTLEELELQRPLVDRTLKPIIQGLSGLVGRFYPANTARSLALKLKRAGMETTSTEFYLGVKQAQPSVVHQEAHARELGIVRVPVVGHECLPPPPCFGPIPRR